MKKSIFFLMMVLGLGLTSCEPMEDIHEEIDSSIENRDIRGGLNYTLTDEDYDALDLGFGSFDSSDDARALIPGLLEEKFPMWGEGSLVNVTFDLYAPFSVEEYTVTSADYGDMGREDDFFSTISQVQDFLEEKFSGASEGSYVELTYNTLADEILYEFDEDDFDVVGEKLGADYPEPASSAAQYNNFDRREGNAAYWSEEMIVEAINAVLLDGFDGVEGQKYNVSYAIYDGSSGTESTTVEFDGNSYVAAGGTAYEFTNEDFDLIGAELGEKYPGPAANAAQYNSFTTDPASDNYWSEDMILEAITIVLTNNFPSAEEGAKFDLTYGAYDGSGVSDNMLSVILSGGAYEVDPEASISTIESTNVFAYTNGSWNQPIILESEDYTEMGQSYPNFDDEDEALYKIAIFLESEYPYAEEGDFVAVAYDFFSGSTSTEYANFVFEGGEWNYIPSVIEETLQFGHNGVTWEPDNTIEYTMTSADFELIGEALIEEYPGPADSAGYYANFDRREGNSNYWSDEMLLEAINILLDNIAPNAEEGQKYVVSFEIFDGSSGMGSLSVIKEGGEWVLNE